MDRASDSADDNIRNVDYFRNSQKMVLNIKERLPLVISCSYNIIKTPGTVSCYVNNYVHKKTFTSQF